MLEHMGLQVLDEHPHRDRAAGHARRSGCTTSACMRAGADTEVEVDALHQVFEDAFGRIFRGEVENDDFNRLVVAARLPARRDRRAARLREVHAPDRLPAVAGVHRGDAGRACRHRGAAGRAVQDALRSRAGRGRRLARRASRQRAIEAALEHVENLSEDRVLRQYLALILATTRTNFWRRDAAGSRAASCRSSSIRRRCRACPSPSRCSRSSSTRRASRACTCAAAGSRAAACAGRTGRRISAPRCWASSRRRW